MENKEDLSALQDYFNNYKTKNQPQKRKTKEEIFAQFFNPTEKRSPLMARRFRILPAKSIADIIQEAYFHEFEVKKPDGKPTTLTLYCHEHNDNPVPKKNPDGSIAKDSNGKEIMVKPYCPMCAKNREILNRQDPSVKGKKPEEMNEMEKAIYEQNRKLFNEAVKYKVREFYIIKGVERGREADGIKFWRFKENHKGQGVLEKMLPIFTKYVTSQNGGNFMDAENGADLSIMLGESSFTRGKTTISYKQVTAVTFEDKSPLYNDPNVVQGWLADTTTWKDVFKPKKAPNITSIQFMELVMQGNMPYWDDSNPNNKHWVFPNNPELEKLANTRKQNLDATPMDNNQQQETTSNYGESGVGINNITPSNVGTFTDSAVDVGNEVESRQNNTQENQTFTNEAENEEEYDEYSFDDDDLPF